MSITVEDINSTKKRVTINIPADVVTREYETSLNAVRKRARIPGFRQGHAPVSMIEKRFGGDIRSDLVDRLVPDYYSKSLREADLVPIAMPSFDDMPEIDKGSPLNFTITVEVRPKIEGLKYEGLKVSAIPVAVEDSEIDETLSNLREQRAMFEVVDREIRADDLIVIDYAKFDAEGTKEIASAKDQVMNLGRGLTPQGILDKILGRKKGDSVEVNLPKVEAGEIREDQPGGDLLRIMIKEVKEKKLPAIDDDLAKDFAQDTLDALKEKIREGILRSKKENAEREQKSKLLEQLVAAQEFDVPESMLAHEIEALRAGDKNRKNPEAGAPEMTEEELKTKALRNVRSGILLEVIAEKESVTVSEEELRTRINLLAKSFQASPEAVVNLFMSRDGSLDGLRHSVREEKVLDLVLSKAEIVQGA